MIVTLTRAARPQCLSPLSAMAAWTFRRPESESIGCSQAEAIELENVVGRAHERPFPLHLLEATQQELSEAARLLNLSNDRFDDSFAGGVDRRTRLRVQLAGHPVDDRRALRQRSPRTGSQALAMFLLPRRDVRVDGRVGDRG